MKIFVRGRPRRVLTALPLGIVLILALSVASTGCPKPKPSGIPVIDLAVGDGGAGVPFKGDDVSEFDSAKVLLYFNVLKGDNQQDPSVVLNGASIPEIQHPISTVLTPHDLYVCDDFTEAVLIWRDYRSLDAKAEVVASPDVVVEGNGILEDPVQILVEDNRLFVADLFLEGDKACCGGVAIFDDAASITEDRFPDLLLDEPGSPTGIAYADDQLYIADADTDRVLVYTSVSGILSAGKGLPSGIVELSGPSWLNLDNSGPIIPVKVDVFDNHLYVTTASNFLFVFSPADALESFQEPDAVISETNGALDAPYGSQLVGDRLYVANLNFPFFFVAKETQTKADTIGMVAFDNATELVTGQLPTLAFDTTHAQIPAVQDLVAEDDVLFVATSVPFDDDFRLKDATKAVFPFGSLYPVGDVHIYLEADKVNTKRPGDIVLPALKDFFGPLSIDTNRQFTGL